ncbi:hypothetical protein R9C00_01955 [Flammeovirgaceae bacterium SG7u.111]|nr:hypothetical protein [Flammeovirgaceae bacterium SG7u.132]WPO36206.1 hypothetical protein R9C00_01955 [Flammeovirgaceae bacterium SG7u.111]
MQLVKIFWFISIIGAFAVNVLCYASFPPVVSYYFDIAGNPEMFIGKELFFYYTFAIILIANILLSLLGKIPAYISKELLIVPRKKLWTQDINTRKELNKKLKEWVRGLAMLINFFIMTILGFIANANTENNFSISWVQYLLLFLAICWLIFFFPLFMRKPEVLRD